MSAKVLTLIVALLVITVALFVYLSSDDTSRYLVFATWGTPAEVGNFQRLVQYYNLTMHPKHPVKLSHADHASYTERLLIQAAARSLPDVIHFDKKDLPLFVHRELLEDLDPYIRGDSTFDLNVFLPELIPGCRINGRMYGIPHNFSTFVIYYNRDHFDAEGLRYPDSTWTWGTLLKAARRLTKRDSMGATLRYGCHVGIILHTLIYQNGGRVLNDALDSCVISSPQSEEAVRFLIDLSEKYHVTWNVLAQNLQWDDMFAGGRCSMIANGRWAAAWYARMMPPGAMDVAPLPHGKLRKGAMVNHMMTISAQSSKKKEAWEFITFLASDFAQRMVNEDGANIPAVRSVVYSRDFLGDPDTPHMNHKVFLDVLPHSVGWPFDQGSYLTQHTLQAETDYALRRILLGEASVRQSLAIMQKNVNRVIATERRVPRPRAFVGSAVFYLCCALVIAATVALWNVQRRKRAHAP